MFGPSGHSSRFRIEKLSTNGISSPSAICLYQKEQKIDGPLFLGMDTHALSVGSASALEVLAANGGGSHDRGGDDEYTPTPVVSHAILTYNLSRKTGLADGIVITPSHNPPDDGGFKYNPPNGGPAERVITDWIEAKANGFLENDLSGVRKGFHSRRLFVPHSAPTTSLPTRQI